MKNILVLGSINTDLVVRTSRFPRQGETVIGSDLQTHFGGKGANQAVAAARLGVPVSMIGRIGNDSFGQAAIDNLRRAGVNIEQVHVDTSAASGTAFIIIDENGNNSIIVSPGANGRIDRDDLDQASEVFTPEATLVTQLEVPINTVIAGIELANTQGCTIILNPSPAMPLEPRILAMVDVLILNETELATLSKSNDIKSGLDCLQATGVETIVLTLGAKGCILVKDNRAITLPALPVPVVDTTGAGDAFLGAFSAALAEDLDIWTACKWGNAAGAVAITSLGAQSSLPSREQLLDVLATDNP